jgi:hypothetical protein
MLTSLAIALVALGVAIGAWVRPLPDSNPPAEPASAIYTDQQAANAKADICAAFEKVRTSVRLQVGANAGDDPVLKQAVAANARLSLIGGAYYLQIRLDPATPPPVAIAIRELSDILLELGVNALAGSTNDQLLEQQADAKFNQLAELCK